MSDHARVLVHPTCTAKEARAFAGLVRNDLVRRKIIVPELSDCTLGDDGHAPGDKVSQALKAGADETAMPDQFATNGVVFYSKKSIFPPIEADMSLTCPFCKETFVAGDDYIDAASSWYEGKKATKFTCPECEKSQPVIDWDGPNPIGLGFFAIEFWNWPDLRPEFIESIEKLVGHRLRRVYVYM